MDATFSKAFAGSGAQPAGYVAELNVCHWRFARRRQLTFLAHRVPTKRV